MNPRPASSASPPEATTRAPQPAPATTPSPRDNGAPARRQADDPTKLDVPVYLMNFPFSFDSTEANNIWMDEMAPEDRAVDRRRAHRQFLDLYNLFASEATVYLLPTPRNCGLQDLVFTANLGIVLEHLEDRPVVVVSNYAAKGRQGETDVGRRFFDSMGFETHVAPAKFEGEADLKHLHDNVFIGGYGQRSELEAYRWMEERFDMRIIKVREADPYLYHLDCSIFPLTLEDTLVCTAAFEKDEVAEMEKHTNVLDVSEDDCFQGICNSVRLHNAVVNSSDIHELKRGTDEYRLELAKNRRLEDLLAELGFEVNFVNLSEYHKGGALLSCLVMHLNRHSYQTRLL